MNSITFVILTCFECPSSLHSFSACSKWRQGQLPQEQRRWLTSWLQLCAGQSRSPCLRMETTKQYCREPKNVYLYQMWSHHTNSRFINNQKLFHFFPYLNTTVSIRTDASFFLVTDIKIISTLTRSVVTRLFVTRVLSEPKRTIQITSSSKPVSFAETPSISVRTKLSTLIVTFACVQTVITPCASLTWRTRSCYMMTHLSCVAVTVIVTQFTPRARLTRVSARVTEETRSTGTVSCNRVTPTTILTWTRVATVRTPWTSWTAHRLTLRTTEPRVTSAYLWFGAFSVLTSLTTHCFTCV